MWGNDRHKTIIMSINSKEILSLIGKDKVSIEKKKEKLSDADVMDRLNVEDVKPLFLYKHHHLDEVQYDTDIECVAMLTEAGKKPRLVRLCCWFNSKDKKLYDKIFVMEQNLHYMKVIMNDKTELYHDIDDDEYTYITQLKDTAYEDSIRLDARKIAKFNDRCPDDIESAMLLDTNLSESEHVIFKD